MLSVTSGIYYTMSGVALFFAPHWFYGNIGPYPPFNHHYEGDLGTFLMPVGIAMVIAARSVFHAVKHLLDELCCCLRPTNR